MPSNAITRRSVLATGITTAAALALGRVAASAEVAGIALRDIHTFYDPRLRASKELAGALPGASQLQAVFGDPAPLLSRLMPALRDARPLRLQGVTTESIPFCLEQLSRAQPEARLQSRRLDRDLFAWSLTVRSRV